MSEVAGMVELFVREIPAQFRGPGFTVIRNNVYELVRGADGALKKKLVTQLQEGQRLQIPATELSRLLPQLGGGAATLATVGGVCSIATLGVVVVGFAALGYGLHRIGKRLATIEQGLERVAEQNAEIADALALLDIKVDHLTLLSREQSEALRQIQYQLHLRDFAEIEGANERLAVRCTEARSERRDREINQAANDLQVHRLRLAQWLADCPPEAGDVAAELAQATTLLALAEARARLLLDDDTFAERILSLAAESVRQAAARATAYTIGRWSLSTVLATEIDGLDVPELVTDTVAWATQRDRDEVAAEHRQRLVVEARAARAAASRPLEQGVLNSTLLGLTPEELAREVHSGGPTGLLSRLRGEPEERATAQALVLLGVMLAGVRDLRDSVVRDVTSFGAASIPASQVAAFDAYRQCGHRLEQSLMGVRLRRLLPDGGAGPSGPLEDSEPATVLRPSLSLEFALVESA